MFVCVWKNSQTHKRRDMWSICMSSCIAGSLFVAHTIKHKSIVRSSMQRLQTTRCEKGIFLLLSFLRVAYTYAMMSGAFVVYVGGTETTRRRWSNFMSSIFVHYYWVMWWCWWCGWLVCCWWCCRVQAICDL